MPLLRRTSDKLAPKKNLQSAPKINDPLGWEKRSGILRKSNEILPKERDICSTKEPHLGSDQDQKIIKDDEEGREKLTHSDHDGILGQNDDKTSLVFVMHSPTSPCGGDKVNQAEPDKRPEDLRNQHLNTGEDKQVATTQCKGFPSETYAPAATGGPIVSNSRIADVSGLAGPEGPTDPQQLIPPKIMSQTSQGDREQACAKSYAAFVTDTCKRKVKKDITSKSCPPLKRDISPAIKAGRNASHDKNYKLLQSTTIGKIKESSQRERSRNRSFTVNEISGPHYTSTNVGNTSSPREVQHAQDFQETADTQGHIVDLIAKLEQEEAEQKKERRARITDSTRKWCSCLSKQHQEKIISLGEKVLRRMDSAMSFLTVASRMLAKANWTRSMIAIDIKQAALCAISKGCYVKAEDFDEYPFTREELAVPAATYLDQIPADTPEDPFRAINVVISHLPHSCTKLFSQGIFTCPYCHASCEVPIPSFITNSSWTMDSWIDIATCLAQADPIPWVQRYGWHEAECERSDHLPN